MSTDHPQENHDSTDSPEQIDLTGTTIGQQADAEQTVIAETSVEPVSEVSVPQLTLGGEIADAEAAAEPEEYVQPVIRGRVDKAGTAIGTGRRKTAVARVRIKNGTGAFAINGRSLEDYFPTERDQAMIKAPLNAVGMLGKVDIWSRVDGGGPTGQTGAIVLGIARALQAKNEEFHPILAEGGYLTRDGRMVERKKYGKKKARRSFQFSKR